ncbi:MAG: hypothetical protein CMD35_06965, partial [Flavobacteriales bacterium]|nr:hypothetical protein [Flavobacteriales bacterium]
MRIFFFLILGVFAVVGLGFFVEDDSPSHSSAEARFKSKKKAPEFTQIESPWVDSIVNSLTLEQKIAQLIMYPVYSKKGESELLKIEKLIKDYEIGGVIYMQGGPVRQVNAHNRLMAKSKIPLLTSIDGEWGVRMRLDSVIRFPRQMLLGAVQDEQLIYDMGVEIAKQCSLTGVHVNFA